MARLFAALVPPAALAELLARGAAGALSPREFALVPAGDLHLTLAFYGQVAEAAIAALEAALCAALAGAPAFDGRLAGTGGFGRPGSERVLWAGLALDAEQRARAVELVRRARGAGRAAGVAVDERTAPEAYVPHVTLARPRGRTRTGEAFRALAFEGVWVSREVLLLESVPASVPVAPGEPRYRPRARFALGAA